MKTIMLILLIGAWAINATAAQVVKVSPASNLFAISHTDQQEFKKDERICIERAGKNVGCGQVLKVIKKDLALAKLTSFTGSAFDVKQGDLVKRDYRKLASTDNNVQDLLAGSQEKSPSRFQTGIELLGAGGLYSAFASYRIIRPLAINFGVSYYSLTQKKYVSTTGAPVSATVKTTYFNFPVSVSGLFGSGRHLFEVLGGALFSKASGTATAIGQTAEDSKFLIEPTIGLGYRLWPENGGFHFRATAYAIYENSSVLPWFGLSLGYAL